MPFARQTLTQLRDGALADIAASLIYDSTTGETINPVLLQFDPLTIQAKVMAGLAYEEYGYLDYISLQATPATAVDEAALQWGALKGQTLKPATAATAVATFTGVANTPIPLGTPVGRSDGTSYVTTEAAEISASTLFVDVPIEAVATGAAGTLAAGATLTISTPIAGVTTDAVVTSSTTPGADLETFDAFKARYLAVYANPPAGGSLTDYDEWALEVPGVTRSWTIGSFLGAGTVGVFVMLDISEAGNNGFPVGTGGVATLETRDAPATGDQLVVANFIYPLRPATALVYVEAPTPLYIDFVIANLGANNTAATQAAVLAALQALFLVIGDVRGVTIQPSAWAGALANALGSIQYDLTSPLAPIVVPVGSLPTVTAAQLTFTS